MICKGLIDFRDLDELSTLILNVLISVIFFFIYECHIQKNANWRKINIYPSDIGPNMILQVNNGLQIVFAIIMPYPNCETN